MRVHTDIHTYTFIYRVDINGLTMQLLKCTQFDISIYTLSERVAAE